MLRGVCSSSVCWNNLRIIYDSPPTSHHIAGWSKVHGWGMADVTRPMSGGWLRVAGLLLKVTRKIFWGILGFKKSSSKFQIIITDYFVTLLFLGWVFLMKIIWLFLYMSIFRWFSWSRLDSHIPIIIIMVIFVYFWDVFSIANVKL